MTTKVLIVEDHSFFANEIREYLEEDKGFTVFYASNFSDAVKIIRKNGPFAFSLLDILLQNGKTGVDIVETYRVQLGRVMFITGCIEEVALAKIAGYASASKMTEIWPKLDEFLEGSQPRINANESAAYRTAKAPLAFR